MKYYGCTIIFLHSSSGAECIWAKCPAPLPPGAAATRPEPSPVVMEQVQVVKGRGQLLRPAGTHGEGIEYRAVYSSLWRYSVCMKMKNLIS